MSHCMRIVVVLAIAVALLVPVTVAQKPPAPPPSTPPIRPATPSPSSLDPNQPRGDLVMFLWGRVAIADGAPVPADMLVERVCKNRVRQEVYASPHGEFNMQLGSRADSIPETRADPTSPYGVANKDAVSGISRLELTNCELRVSASGFHSSVINLMGLDTFGSSVDVGVIIIHRATKSADRTLSATPYKAPKDARSAYAKGLQAERNGKLADARKYFETAVEIYPSFASAWFYLGTVLQRENQEDAARKAYTQATTADTKFLPPYLALASMAYQTGNWTEVLSFTGHILDLDPLNNAAVTSYILDLDPLNYAGAYFYNAVANYKLNRIEEAEKSGIKAEHLDLRTHFPELHLLLAEIFARKKNYALAITEIQTYLALAPNGRAADQARKQLTELEKLSGSVSTIENPQAQREPRNGPVA